MKFCYGRNNAQNCALRLPQQKNTKNAGKSDHFQKWFKILQLPFWKPVYRDRQNQSPHRFAF